MADGRQGKGGQARGQHSPIEIMKNNKDEQEDKNRDDDGTRDCCRDRKGLIVAHGAMGNDG